VDRLKNLRPQSRLSPRNEPRRHHILFGNYELLERIKIGGMAEIVKARDLTGPGNTLLAVKRILPHLTSDKQYVAMFLDESRVLAALHHDCIVRTLEVGQIDDTPFIALEYVWGQDARALFHRARRTHQPIPIRIACYVMAQVCAGLDYAHESRDEHGKPLGIVHRDVSLQNILIGYSGAVKLSDFGIATSLQSTARTQAGVVKGNLGYMSPEQLKGEATDRRSDVFAAGICLYELLTCERLFSGATDYASVTKLRYGAIEPPSRFNREIPLSLEEVVMRALSRQPDDRFQTALAMRAALLAFMAEANNGCSADDLGAHMRVAFADLLRRRPTPFSMDPGGADDIAAGDTNPAQHRSGDSSVPWRYASASDVFLRQELPNAGYAAAPDPDEDPRTSGSGAWVREHVSGVQTSHVRDPRTLPPADRGPTEPVRPSPPPPGPAPTTARAPIAYGAVVGTVAGIIAVIVGALYLNSRMRPASIHLETSPTDPEILVDGRRIEVDHSPFVIGDLAPDEQHHIEVRKSGYRSWSTRLALRSGEVVHMPKVSLTPRPVQP
jgi:eukaryotic-like serine/threonine-protein kinase